MTTLSKSILKRLDRLPKGLAEHIKRARVVGRALAIFHDVDSEKVDFSLATHDLARALSGEELVAEAERLILELTPVELKEPILIHGAIAALWLEREEGVSDTEILEAVRWHTTGACGIGDIAKVVFLADKLDPEKLRYYPFQQELNEIARVNLDRATLYFIDKQIEYFVTNDYLIHPNSIDLRNELVLSLEAQQ